MRKQFVIYRISFVLLMASGVACLGCSNAPTGEVVPTVPASGTVKFQGKPLEHYLVLFEAEDQRPASGNTDAEGRFVLGTNDTGDGAPTGTYRVAVRYVGPPDFDPGAGGMDFAPLPPPKVKIPKKYGDIEKSGLSVSIPESGNTEIVLDLK